MTGAANKTTTDYDYLIVGAGPAGLQLGYFLAKTFRNYLILEANACPGSFFERFPRHRQLISTNKVYTGFDDSEVNLRFDWNSLLGDTEDMLFRNYSKRYFPDADDLVRYLGDYAKHYCLNIRYGTRVVEIYKQGRTFTLVDAQGLLYTCRILVIASGMWRPYLPAIPGIELAERYDEMSIDADNFQNQKVLIIGKGNSAFETADNLIASASILHVASPTPVKLAWKTHFVGHLRAVNNNFIDTYQLKTQNAVLDATINKIERRGAQLVASISYSHANGQGAELIYDRAIACTGWQFDSSIFDESCCPELTINDRFPDQSSEWESTNIKDMYFAGALTQMRDYKKTTSGFIKGFRYNIRALHRRFEEKYEGNPWPFRPLRPTTEALAEAVLDRINRSSALWQQFGFLCDLIIVPRSGGAALYYEEMPSDYVHDSELGRSSRYYTVALEFGEQADDPLSAARNPDPYQGQESRFLHPVIRHYSGASLVSEHHITEDLYSDWSNQELHIQPFLEFLTSINRAAAV